MQSLNNEQGIEWVKSQRLGAFLESDCYAEYRLAKLLSQVSSKPPLSELFSVKINYSNAVAQEDNAGADEGKNEDEEEDAKEDEESQVR